MGSDTSSRREMKSDPLPRTSRTLVPAWREGYSRAVRGWRMVDAASDAIDSAIDEVLCTPYSIPCPSQVG